MQAVRERIERVAATDFVALIDGESGTGKELVARQMPRDQRVAGGPFVPVNCAALVESLLKPSLSASRTARPPVFARAPRQVRVRRRAERCFSTRWPTCRPRRKPSPRKRAPATSPSKGYGGHGLHRAQYAGRGGDQQETARARRGPPLSRRISFTGWLRHRDPGAAVARPARGHSRALRRTFSSGVERRAVSRSRSCGSRRALLTYDWPGNVRELERMMERTVALGSSRHRRGRAICQSAYASRVRRCAACHRCCATTRCAPGAAPGYVRPVSSSRSGATSGQPRRALWHQLSHAAWRICAMPPQASGEQRARNLTRILGRELAGRTRQQLDRRIAGRAAASAGSCASSMVLHRDLRRTACRGPPDATGRMVECGYALEPHA